MATQVDKHVRLAYKDIPGVQIKFLTALAKLESRTEDGKRRIDVEDGYQERVVEEAKKYNWQIMAHRFYVLKDAENGIKGHSAETVKQAIMTRSAEDLLYWINEFGWLRNPHLTRFGFPIDIPFVLYPKQEEYMAWRTELYNKGKSGVVYKCREVGASWLNVAWQTHRWFFESGYQGRFGSLKAEEVDDKNDPDSLLQKVRTIIYRTPKWMRPEAYHSIDGNNYDTKMKIVNPGNGAVISGQQGDSMGRGGRSSLFDVDEWAKVDHARAVDANLSANTPCRIYTSTPIGRDNDFAEKVRQRKLPVFEFNYWDDPRKSKDWFANFSEANTEPIVQQEVLKSFDAYKYGTAISGEWVAAAVTLYERIKAGDVEYNADYRSAGLDVAAGGRHSSVLVWREGICLEEEHEWNIRNSTTVAEKAVSVSEERGCDVLGFDPIGVGHGVRSALERMETACRVVTVDARGSASELPMEGDTRPARDRCQNRRAELMERMRLRFERTFEYITKDIDHPIDALVAISPSCQKTIGQLPVPDRLVLGKKIRMESKEQMVARGEESPDFFDAFLICWADEVVETHVVKTFNPKQDGLLEREDLPVRAIVGSPSSRHYISLYHSETLNAAAIGAVWTGSVVTVYDELLVPNPSVSNVISCLRTKFPTANVYEWVGNKTMFKQGQDDLFFKYLQSGIMFVENCLYNEIANVAMLNQMFEQQRIKICKRCKILLRQLDNFTRIRRGPDLTNMELAMALGNLINRLDEMGVVESRGPAMTDYGHRIVDGRRIPREEVQNG